MLGLDAAIAGLAIAAALCVDAVSDPLVGYLSDRLRSPLGGRHKLMYAAAAPVAVSYLLLFSPPADLAPMPLFLYLAGVAIVVRISIALYEIPSAALLPDLARDYDERTAFVAARYFFGWSAGLAMSILAFSVFLAGGGPAAGLHSAGFHRYALFAAAAMFVTVLVSAAGTQSAVRPAVDTPARAPHDLAAELRAALATRSAIAVPVAVVLMTLATGLSWGLGTYFSLYAFGLSTRAMAVLTASGFISAALSLLITPALSARLDKRGAALAVAVLLLLLLPLPIVLSVAGLLPTAASGRLLPLLAVLNISSTAFLIAVPTLLSSMAADVVDEVELRTGHRCEGMIFAIGTFAQKGASGLAVLGATALLRFAHFPTHARPGAVPVPIIMHLSAAYIAVLATLYTGSIAAIALYAITRHSHATHVALLSRRRTAAGGAV